MLGEKYNNSRSKQNANLLYGIVTLFLLKSFSEMLSNISICFHFPTPWDDAGSWHVKQNSFSSWAVNTIAADQLTMRGAKTCRHGIDPLCPVPQDWKVTEEKQNELKHRNKMHTILLNVIQLMRL